MRQMRQKSALGEPKQPTEKPVLADAIDMTLRTIEDRTKLYRNLTNRGREPSVDGVDCPGGALPRGAATCWPPQGWGTSIRNDRAIMSVP